MKLNTEREIKDQRASTKIKVLALHVAHQIQHRASHDSLDTKSHTWAQSQE